MSAEQQVVSETGVEPAREGTAKGSEAPHEDVEENQIDKQVGTAADRVKKRSRQTCSILIDSDEERECEARCVTTATANIEQTAIVEASKRSRSAEPASDALKPNDATVLEPTSSSSFFHLLQDPSWKQALAAECEKPYFQKLQSTIDHLYASCTVFPPKELVFAALNVCPLTKVKVVIVGQDPYHNPGAAVGMAFSVKQGMPVNPSLRNIFKEVSDDVGKCKTRLARSDGDLTCWATQGVLLLNTVLTVTRDMPGSHQSLGWEQFTDCILRKVNCGKNRVVFVLWGKTAQDKAILIDRHRHLVLSSAHPSPYSADRGFFRSKPFSKANAFLLRTGQTDIDWD